MGRRRAAAAGASDRARRRASVLFVALFVMTMEASAQIAGGDGSTPSSGDVDILGHKNDGLRIQSVMTRITAFDQYGHGYQSQAGPVLGPGSERATILEPQLQVVATQGDRLTHVITVPIDVVTAASPNSISPKSVDVLSGASRHVVSGTLDWGTTYRMDSASDLSMTSGLHLEEPFRSWHGGLGGSHSFAGGDTVVSANVIEVFDWFDRFDIMGNRHGRAERSSTTASIGVTQIVTPTMLVGLNYGLTVQQGELGNTWNSVPLTSLERGPEILPDERVRHAFVARAAQFLPWNGALRLYYRFYVDDWGVVANSLEGQILQRLSRFVYVSALYRYHEQSGVDFYTTRGSPDLQLRTADSDLATLHSQTVGGKISVDAPMNGDVRVLHFEAGYEYYVRDNGLSMNIVTCATGYHF
jgi:uncharacterized protein DUF3570